MLKQLSFIVIVLFTLLACQSNGKKGETTHKEQPQTQLEIDQDIIEQHLEKSAVEAKRAPAGFFYTIEEKGEGAHIEAGTQVKFHTIGKLLNGTQFYSSYEEGQPLETIIGQKMVVPGMEQGLQYFNAGGKGTLYLPSKLGYGKEGFGKQIPPNAVIVFEVEVLSVEQ